jgi:DNA-binding response OmpR family regulator
VLVVDDESSIRLLCRVNLELGGYEVAEAANGTEALARAQDGSFGLVVLDVMMPGIGGHDVARLLAQDERTRDLPVVFLSARADRENLRRGYELGAVDYITKPFEPTELAARVTQALERVKRGDSERFRIERLAELEE